MKSRYIDLKFKIKWFLQDLKNLPKATYLCFKYPFLKFYNKRNRFFQTSCYLFCMPIGWRKAFGIQMCNEIKESLLRTGGKSAVNNYYIDDVKEKFGGLRWYDSHSTVEVEKIINKYENISYHTCIVCGKPANVRTTGWICPYCNEHIPEHQNYIHFGHKHGMSWYGWTGNIDRIPEEEWNEEEELFSKFYGTDNTTSSEKASD